LLVSGCWLMGERRCSRFRRCLPEGSECGRVLGMNAYGFAAVLAGLCSGLMAGGQTGPTQEEIAARLQGPVVIVRGMYAGDRLSFDAQGNLIGQASELPLSLSAVKVDKIHLTDAELRIEATRSGLEFQQKRGGVPVTIQSESLKRERVEIRIARDPQHPELLDAAIGKVLAVGLDDEVAAAAPPYWRPWLHYYLHPDDPSNDSLFRAKSDAIEWKKKGIAPPRLVAAPDPNFSNAARANKYQGTVLIGLIVDAQGAPERVVILKPLGMGLDEMAVEAVRQYKFAAATQKGQPIEVEIHIQVNFRIY
jgi:TonB family protein